MRFAPATANARSQQVIRSARIIVSVLTLCVPTTAQGQGTTDSASRLLSGGHEGKDLTASDGVFEILIVRGVRAVVVVTSGNSTFETGPRKHLLGWLHRQEAILRKDTRERRLAPQTS